jgi:sugar lactone lactonase YvrE
MQRAITVFLVLAALGCRSSVTFPVKPEPFITQFRASEGLTFNGAGQLFIGANRAVWIARPDGSVQKIAGVDTHLGQAGVGDRDILAADFGPTNVFRDGPNDDGVVWRITPDGTKTAAARGIADPNFILVLKDGTWLVSDDGTDKIYRVRAGGKVEVWSSAVAYPNGMALSLDERTLYVAQIFSALGPVVYDNRVWAIPLTETFDPAGAPVLLARTGNGVDGLAVDEHGFVYVADNQGGRIWRVDPRNGATVVIAEGMSNVASLAFGEGEFDHRAIYATTTERGGGTIWKVRVGVRGARLHR